MPTPPSRQRPGKLRSTGDTHFKSSVGIAQLSLVEHALCPLDIAAACVENFRHETRYTYTDASRHSRMATARVTSTIGLSPHDELYLWGLLSLALSQPEPTIDFYATPHYCLRQLGCIDSRSARGGKQYALFRESIRRLSRVTYENDRFYDPVRGEHREVSFGFLSYSLPIDPKSSRAWRFAWNPIFFEFCQAVRGRFTFDLATYRQLDCASRRLFLLLQKIFWRRTTSPTFDVHHLAIDVLGFSPTIDIRNLKQKLSRCMEALQRRGIIALPEGVMRTEQLFQKKVKGQYTVIMERGAYFDRTLPEAMPAPEESPLYEVLKSIGFDGPGIQRVLQTYKPREIQEWADITLAAKERNGDAFFKRSPQAYFIDNIRAASKGERTPPDWWHELRKEETRRQRKETRSSAEAHREHQAEERFEEYLATEAREAFERVMDRVFQDLCNRGKSETEARERAEYLARMDFQRRFRQEHPEWNESEPARAGEFLTGGLDQSFFSEEL